MSDYEHHLLPYLYHRQIQKKKNHTSIESLLDDGHNFTAAIKRKNFKHLTDEIVSEARESVRVLVF